MSLLYALGLIQPIVNFLARILRRTMNLSGAEALSGAANIFVGVEALTVVRPYLQDMTRSELCAILASGFGSIASTVLALYSQLLRPTFPNITSHLISASIMAIPACFVMAKILVPETEAPKTLGTGILDRPTNPATLPPAEPALVTTDKPTAENLPAPVPTAPITKVVSEIETDAVTVRMNPMESLIAGAMDGVKLAVAIAALLIAILGLIALVNLFFANLAGLSASRNILLKGIGDAFRVVTVQNFMGALFLPLTFLTGVSFKWQELWQISQLIGQRLLETEVPSYLKLATLSQQGLISDRALLVTSYALCGFAHLPSVGIFVGGLAGLVPNRRKEIAELGWRALWAATLGTLMIGCVAGLFDFGNPSILGR
jgi:CNT family concentrative nucleoside transporter